MFVKYVYSVNTFICIVMQEASDAHSKTADSDTVSTYQVSSVQLVTDKKTDSYQNSVGSLKMTKK